LGAVLFVAAGATDCAAVGGVFALAMAIGERALAALNAIVRAVATAATVAQHAAKILQRARG
jgi:TRAP-type mannitol/chloroaromatic compound transport system permease large subunit